LRLAFANTHASGHLLRSVIWLIREKTVCSMNSIRPSNICALLAKWRYRAASLTSSRAASAAVVMRSAAGLLQHGGQRLQDLDTPLTGLGPLAHRNRG
jgi:hypothetical protein